MTFQVIFVFRWALVIRMSPCFPKPFPILFFDTTIMVLAVLDEDKSCFKKR